MLLDISADMLLLNAEFCDVADQSEVFGECIGCTRKCSCTKIKSCRCWNVGSKNRFPLYSEEVGVGMYY